MNTIDSAMFYRFFLPEKKEEHVSNYAIYNSLRTCLAFGSTAKYHYQLINSLSLCPSLIASFGPHPIFESCGCKAANECKGILAHQFRQLTPWIKDSPAQNNREFTGIIFGDAFGSQDGIEVFALQEGGNNLPVFRFLLEENNHLYSQIGMPNTFVTIKNNREFPTIARSKDFIAINRRSDSAVLCFSKEYIFVKHYEVTGEILELIIREDILYIREWTEDKKDKISISYLNAERNLFEVIISDNLSKPCVNCAFGETHVLFINGNQLIATPLISFTKQRLESGAPMIWITAFQFYSFHYILSYGEDFIGIEQQTNTIQIVKIKILEENLQTELLEQCSIEGVIVAAHLHLGRLFFAIEKFGRQETYMYSYDLETNKLKQLLSSPTQQFNMPFRPKFLCTTALKVHYLVMGISTNVKHSVQINSFLTTFDYSQAVANLLE